MMHADHSATRAARRGARSLAAFAAYALRHAERAALFRRCVRSLAVALSADGTDLVCVEPTEAHRLAACGMRPAGLGPCEAPLSRYVLRKETAVSSDDLTAERRFLCSARWREQGMLSAASAPVPPQHGASERYVLTAFSRTPRHFDAESVAMVQAYARVLGAALERRLDAREATSVLLENFAAVLAHEVRNPLNALAMNAEVASMLLGSQRGDDVPKVLERLGRDVQRCGAAIRELSAVVARDVPDEGIALDDLLGGIAERLRQGAIGGTAFEVELDAVDEALSYAGNLAAIEFAIAQMARTVVVGGVKGVRIAVEREPDGYAIEVERLPSEGSPFRMPMATLSPTRAAAYAVARHALETAGARLQPEVLVDVPERCRVSFPAPAIRSGHEA